MIAIAAADRASALRRGLEASGETVAELGRLIPRAAHPVTFTSRLALDG
jgi:hypothetical protein